MKEFVKRHIYIILGVVCIGVMGVLFITGANRPAPRVGEPLIPSQSAFAAPRPDEPEHVVVHILGAVYNPGVYTLPAGTRVTDAVEMAGGYTEDADLTRVNLAAPLRDAMQIIVPALGDPTAAIPPTGGGLVNINTATLTELQTLPGIGPARAQSVIDFRDAAGGFTQIEDLLNVSGIGNTIFNGLKDFITVGG
jgi:competence protein ComEA